MNPKRHYNRHGMTKSPMWNLYFSIRQRCNDPNSKSYIWYGARGIKCEWKSFQDFYNDMGERPEGMTIERINSNDNYGPANCRWATPAEQARNTSQNHWLTFDGRTQCLTDWCQELGIKKTTLTMRLSEYGWAVDRALTTPVRGIKL